MKKHLKIAFVVAALFSTPPVLSSADQFKVTKVYDGDTVRAETPGVVLYIMLVGIDAPEISNQADRQKQPFAAEAKEFLSNLVLNKVVEVEGYGTAPYPHNNILGMIYLGGKNINLEMIRKGYAQVCSGTPPSGLDVGPFLSAEKRAKESGNGIWGLGDNYISPMQWRNMQSRK
jgi:micrococcal nuclease